MLLYLFSLCSSEDFRKEVEAEQLLPAGVLYLSGNVPTLSLDRNAEEAAVLSEAEKAISRSGLLLDDADVLYAMNNELSPAYLPGVRQTADGHLNGRSLVAAVGFEDLQKKIEGVLTRIAETMRSGAADATPFRHGNVDPCKYCTVRAVCRRTETAPAPANPIERSAENGT
jgi:ATP-dependent helicase/nuclease subunit B